jgi:hypothetical protein
MLGFGGFHPNPNSVLEPKTVVFDLVYETSLVEDV